LERRIEETDNRPPPPERGAASRWVLAWPGLAGCAIWLFDGVH